jgi:drug/metabolite transporter (DMT)-like permease
MGIMRMPILFGCAAGVFSYGGLQLFTYALERGPASIISPIFAMNGLIFALLTIVTLKEKISQYQALALIGCVVGLVLIRM